MLGQIAYQKIEDERGKLEKLAMDIWANPEGPYREFKAQEWTAKLLEDAGFTVENGAGGVPTAIKASWGSGHPVIGFLGEYDALPGMSNEVCAQPKPIPGQAYGQGCGHNLLGVGCVAAVIGLKAEMEASGLPGTVIYFGCPAEEVLTGKAFMARGGAFDELDASIAWHPDRNNLVQIGRNAALNSVKFHFTGKSAHAGGDPHNGRSALDAVELMNSGANYLREHVTDDVRIHYIITDGGMAPNIVPEKASSYYFIRAMTREAVVDTYNRILKIAEGAALMTETKVEVEFLGGCYQRLTNMVMSNLLNDCLKEAPADPFTDEEKAFAHELNMTSPEAHAELCRMYNVPPDTEIFEGVAPMDAVDVFGSSDVGDVQHIAPGVYFSTSCFNFGTPYHSWQISACSGSSIGTKGMIYAARTMALAGLKLITQPDLLAAAKADFDKSMAGRKYECPITPEIPIP